MRTFDRHRSRASVQQVRPDKRAFAHQNRHLRRYALCAICRSSRQGCAGRSQSGLGSLA